MQPVTIACSLHGDYTVRVIRGARIAWVRGVKSLRDARMTADVLQFMLDVSGRADAIRAALALCWVRNVSIFVKEGKPCAN